MGSKNTELLPIRTFGFTFRVSRKKHAWHMGPTPPAFDPSEKSRGLHCFAPLPANVLKGRYLRFSDPLRSRLRLRPWLRPVTASQASVADDCDNEITRRNY